MYSKLLPSIGLVGLAAIFVVVAVAPWEQRERASTATAASNAESGLQRDSQDARAAGNELGDARTIPAVEMPILLASASDAERAFLEDGVVARDELDAAFLAANACTQQAAQAYGVQVAPPTRDGSGLLQFGGMSATEKGSLDSAGQAHVDCFERHYNQVHAGWSLAGTYAAKQPLWDKVAACLRDKGYGTPNGLSRVEVALTVGKPGDDISDFYACEDEASLSH